MLHDATDNASPIIINTKCILMVKKSKELNGATDVYLTILDGYLEDYLKHTVTETPEQILEMLK